MSVYVPYVLGCDIGQSQDPTALCVMRRVPKFGDTPSSYQIGSLDRLELGLSYLDIASKVAQRLGQLPPGTELVCDATGCGRPVLDLFRGIGLNPIGVLITPGTAETYDHVSDLYHVPKLTLVSGLQAVLHSYRLDIAADLDHADTLVSELRNFRETATAAGVIRYSARSGSHDDILLAASLSIWRLRQGTDDEFGGGVNVQEFMKNEIERQKEEAQLDAQRFDRDAQHLPWHKAKKPAPYVPDPEGTDFEELSVVYWETYNGLEAAASTSVCYSCNQPIGPSYHTDGLVKWHTTCLPPGVSSVPTPGL